MKAKRLITTTRKPEKNQTAVQFLVLRKGYGGRDEGRKQTTVLSLVPNNTSFTGQGVTGFLANPECGDVRALQ